MTARQDRPTFRVASHMLAIVAVLTLSFLLELTLLGGLRQARDQAQDATQLRNELARATAPVSALDQGGHPLPSATPVGLLEIPRLGLRQIVVEGTSSNALMSGPGHRRDTPLPGQAGASVIAGRQTAYGGPFRSIGRLHPGDAIQVITGQGRNTFAVLGVRHAGDPLPPTLSPGQGRLTLVTSDGPAFRPTDVLRVDARLTTDTQPAGVALSSSALPAAEVVMAGDGSALSAVVAWAALVLVAALGTVWVRHSTGRWQAWVIGVPVLATLGLTAADEIVAMLPNLL
ncbi:MAG TPA: class E sortase [Pseudonocardiaceae bacterium]|jgi:LPXTG-site transpeptidase (sortase) family protein